MTTYVDIRLNSLLRNLVSFSNFSYYLVDEEGVARVGVDHVNALVGELVQRKPLRQALLQNGRNLRYSVGINIPHTPKQTSSEKIELLATTFEMTK